MKIGGMSEECKNMTAWIARVLGMGWTDTHGFADVLRVMSSLIWKRMYEYRSWACNVSYIYFGNLLLSKPHLFANSCITMATYTHVNLYNAIGSWNIPGTIRLVQKYMGL